MPSRYDPNCDVFKRFDSVQDVADFICENVPANLMLNSGEADFYGIGINAALDKVVHGDLTHIEAAQKIISQMEDQNVFSSGVPVIRAAIQGYVPNVPAVIMGHPEGFLARFHDDASSINTPLNVYIETSISAGVSEQQILKRGVAVIAFVLAMSQIRPVQLYATYAGRDNGTNFGLAVNLGTTPLNLAVATWSLTHRAFCRRIGFHYMMAHTKKPYGSIPWAWSLTPTSKDYIDSNKAAFEMRNDDVFIPGAHLFDSNVLNNPIDWVKAMVAKHTQAMEGE